MSEQSRMAMFRVACLQMKKVSIGLLFLSVVVHLQGWTVLGKGKQRVTFPLN